MTAVSPQSWAAYQFSAIVSAGIAFISGTGREKARRHSHHRLSLSGTLCRRRVRRPFPGRAHHAAPGRRGIANHRGSRRRATKGSEGRNVRRYDGKKKIQGANSFSTSHLLYPLTVLPSYLLPVTLCPLSPCHPVGYLVCIPRFAVLGEVQALGFLIIGNPQSHRRIKGPEQNKTHRGTSIERSAGPRPPGRKLPRVSRTAGRSPRRN